MFDAGCEVPASGSFVERGKKLHRRYCDSCRSGETWPIGWWHAPMVTSQYLREQAALAVLRAEQEDAIAARRLRDSREQFALPGMSA